MEQRLYDAAVAGDVTNLLQLIEEDPLLLNKVNLNCQDKNPLHVAAMFGHVNFVKEILQNNSNMCLVPDRFGRNPLHLAAIEGRLEILQKLIDARPQAAREKTAGGDTVLHLCIKYNQLEALKSLVETVKDQELVNVKNGEGMTVLHLAICNGQNETIEYLLGNKKLDVNALNANGNTALDLFQGDTKSDIARSLKAAGAKRGKNIGPAVEWLIEERGAIMVAASLIATMAFQAGVTPPGGVWQDDCDGLNDSKCTIPHMAGEAVMALKIGPYERFIRANTAAFVSSLSVILLLLSGLPFQRSKFFTRFLTVVMWMTIIAAALTYVFSIRLVSPSFYRVTIIGVLVWYGVMVLLVLGNTIQLLQLIDLMVLKHCRIDLLQPVKHDAQILWNRLLQRIKRGNWSVLEKTNDKQENIQMSSV